MKIIPTCIPETQRIWLTPAEAYRAFSSGSMDSLLPRRTAVMTAYSSPFNPLSENVLEKKDCKEFAVREMGLMGWWVSGVQ